MRGHEKKNSQYFSEWLTRTLNEREIAGGEVARALGVNDSAISRWKNAKATPGLGSVMALADFLKVDPIALAVTAGLMKSGDVGVEKLPMPEDTKTRDRVRDQIMSMSGLTLREKEALLGTYERINERV